MPQAFYCKDRQQLNLKHTSIKLFQQLSKPRISNKNSTDKASLGSGPQHRKFQTEILQTKQVGVRGPNIEISNKNSTDKASWGSGPQHREFQTKILQTKQVGVRGPNIEISNKNSTDKASWGSGPQHRNSNRNSTDKASWGSGPQHRNFKQKFYRQGKLGFGVCLDNALITYAPLKPFIKIQSVNKINVYSFIYITHLSL